MEKTNSRLIPNTTQIPNIILDSLFPRLPEAEGRCLLYICRRTFGFHREYDQISFSQFIDGIKSRDGKILDFGTKLSRQSVNIALKNLINSGAVSVAKVGQNRVYKINLSMNVLEVVNKIDQSRKLTASSLRNRPKQVKLFDLQKKGKKEKIDFSNQDRGQIGDNQKNEGKLKALASMKAELIRKKIIH